MADPKNKWSQPVNPPAPMFFGAKERNLVKQVNDELAERVVGQTIAYYPISIEDSNFSDIYGESIEKVSLPPVRVFAYVTVENEQTNDRYGYEYQNKLTVNFHRKRLVADQNLYVRVGDFIQYGDKFYEIVKTYNDTRYYFGQVEHKFQITADCIQARAGNFQVMPGLTRPVDTSVDAVDGSTASEPRAAPYPPVDADYITLTRNTKLVNARYLAAGAGITLTDGGRMSTLTIAATAADSVLTAISSTTAYTTSSVSFGTSDTPDHTVSISGSLSASVSVSASAFYGDGSSLSGIAGSPGGSTTQIQYNSAGSFAGSSNLTFNGTTLTGSYTGSLAEFVTLSASLMNLTPNSGSLGGGSSYLGLDASNNLILTSAAASATSPGGSTTEVQYNSGGSFAGSSNFTFDGTTITVTGDVTASINMSASAFYGDGSNLSGIATTGGIFTTIDGSNAYVTSSINIGSTATPTHPLTVIGASHLSGGLIHKRTAITNDYSIALTDYYLGVDTTSNTVDLTLPAASTAAEGQTYIIKDEGANAVTNVITILRSASDTIDGTTSLEVGAAYGALSLYTDGVSSWYIY